MKALIIVLIKIYKKSLSKVFEVFGFKCKFYPTCSEYMKQAVGKYGILRGGLLSARRILRCNPFSRGGYDPIK